jgi:hypothetical protein
LRTTGFALFVRYYAAALLEMAQGKARLSFLKQTISFYKGERKEHSIADGIFDLVCLVCAAFTETHSLQADDVT